VDRQTKESSHPPGRHRVKRNSKAKKKFPSKEKVVGRLKVRVKGLSQSAAHKRIFILGSPRSISSLATNRGAGFQRSHSRFPDFLLRKTKMNKNVSKTTTMLFYCVPKENLSPISLEKGQEESQNGQWILSLVLLAWPSKRG
jgi:hypothetical protein